MPARPEIPYIDAGKVNPYTVPAHRRRANYWREGGWNPRECFRQAYRMRRFHANNRAHRRGLSASECLYPTAFAVTAEACLRARTAAR